jgi:hypothetical protein
MKPFLSMRLAGVMVTVSAGLLPAAEPLRHEQPFRNLSVSVPKLAQPPTLDGTVDPSEWAGAGMAPRLVMFDREGDDRLTDERAHFYFGYTDDALWMAWQIERPREALAPKATITQPDRSFWRSDDTIELMLNCTPAGKDRPTGRDYYLIWNALGTKYDRSEALSGATSMEWTGDWKAVTRPDSELGWEGELRIPLAILEGAETPSAGVRWRFQLAENRATPEPLVSLAGFAMRWGDSRDFPTLLLTGDDGVFARSIAARWPEPARAASCSNSSIPVAPRKRSSRP